MTDEEFDEFMELPGKEWDKYLDDLFEQEAEIWIEKMHEVGLCHVGRKDTERIQAELVSHGAEMWFKLCEDE